MEGLSVLRRPYQYYHYENDGVMAIQVMQEGSTDFLSVSPAAELNPDQTQPP